MSTKYVSSGGASFASLLTLLFVYFKLTHVINWSWWWVFSPVLISTAIGLFIIAVILILWLILKLNEN